MPAPRKNRRPRRPLSPAPAEPSAPKWWLIALILFSLLAHVLIVLAFVFIGRHTPKWKDLAKDAPPPEVTLTLAQPPPLPLQRPTFIPTEPDPNAPKQNSPLISDNESALKSRDQATRKANVPLPDVKGHPHASDLREKPPSPASKPQPATPPTPKSQQQPPQPNPAKPNPATKPEPPTPTQAHPSDNPEKTAGKQDVKRPVQPQPENPDGLPVLPPIPAPTIAQESPQTVQIQQVQRKAAPQSAPSFAVHQTDVSGQAGAPGDNSPSAMATDLGRYKAKVYRAVGSRWYAKIGDQQMQVLGVGTVHISYRIYADGHMEILGDPDGHTPSLMMLHSISLNSMTEAAPFEPFSDKMKKEVGESYTDDFSFSIYGD
jgi:hypothetical protein